MSLRSRTSFVDDVGELFVLRTILATLAAILSAYSKEALVKLPRRFAAILLDVYIPNSMAKTAELIRGHSCPGTPIIFLTAHDIDRFMEQGYLLSVDFW